MHDGAVKSLEDMNRDELIAAATFWRAEYRRVAEQASESRLKIYDRCGFCGIHHDPTMTCTRLGDGTVSLHPHWPLNG